MSHVESRKKAVFKHGTFPAINIVMFKGGINIYLSKKHLSQKEGIDQKQADEIWHKYYFFGWNSPLSIVTLLVLIALVFFLKLPLWLVPTVVLFVHAFIAIPLASKHMKVGVSEVLSPVKHNKSSNSDAEKRADS
jgi:hypothetical protein